MVGPERQKKVWTSARVGILSLSVGGYAVAGLGALVGNSGGLLLLTLGVIAFLVAWIWALVVSAQIQRWGWLVAHLLVPGISVPLYALFGPVQPAVTGALGVQTRLPPSMPSVSSTVPGVVVAPGVPSAGASGQWEYCEIEFYDEGYFAANAVGPRGFYVAAQNRGRCVAESSNILVTGRTMQPGRGCQVLLNELISALAADGWELTGEAGQNYWNRKFRRVIR
jgi:hypothetical protein